ncbi:MAG TPA: hypothetical protein VES42_01565, partial [Pilimelia sp.]|nr:hypothetical protein [Pilimelia sp.]
MAPLPEPSGGTGAPALQPSAQARAEGATTGDTPGPAATTPTSGTPGKRGRAKAAAGGPARRQRAGAQTTAAQTT